MKASNGKIDDIDLKVKLAKREKINKEQNLPSVYRPRILGPNHSWKICHTQREAFQVTKSGQKDLHVFSFESESFQDQHGKRIFLVTSYEEFWHYYSQLKSTQRHHYEIIPEGSVCHLYFDLEFPKEQNPARDGSPMTAILIKLFTEVIKMQWGLECTEKDIIQLDASTGVKFSRHLVFHMKNSAFKDNVQMGDFVHHIHDLLLNTVHGNITDVLHGNNHTAKNTQDDQSFTCSPQDENGSSTPNSTSTRTNNTDEIESENKQDKLDLSNLKYFAPELLSQMGLTKEDLKMLLVKNKDGKETWFCDTGVYTKNRNFRLYLSSKLGKNNPLKVSEDNQYVSDVPKKKTPSLEKIPKQEEILFLDSLVSNVRYSDNLQILTFEKESSILPVQKYSPRDSRQCSSDSLEGYQSSPYPEIDNFIKTVINKGGVQGAIRRWLYFSQGETIVYDISRNRWCENIGRAHKSNNIMIVVDLRAAVYCQKCHDPECRQANYRSPDYPLPKEILQLYQLSNEMDASWPDDNLDELSDEQLSALVTETCESFEQPDNTNSNLKDKPNGENSSQLVASPSNRSKMNCDDDSCVEDRDLSEESDFNTDILTDDELLKFAANVEESFNK